MIHTREGLNNYLHNINAAILQGENPPSNIFLVLCEYAKTFKEPPIRQITQPTYPRHDVNIIKEIATSLIDHVDPGKKWRIHEIITKCDEIINR